MPSTGTGEAAIGSNCTEAGETGDAASALPPWSGLEGGASRGAVSMAVGTVSSVFDGPQPMMEASDWPKSIWYVYLLLFARSEPSRKALPHLVIIWLHRGNPLSRGRGRLGITIQSPPRWRHHHRALKHERDAARLVDSTLIPRVCRLGECGRVGSVGCHNGMQAAAARYKAIAGLGIVLAADQAHILGHAVSVKIGRAERVLGHHPARRKDDKIREGDARSPSFHSEYGKYRRILLTAYCKHNAKGILDDQTRPCL